MSPEAQPDLHLIVEVEVVRPVMGSVRSRFFAHLPVQAVRPPKIPSNSFIHRTLPITPKRSRICARFRVSLSKQVFCEVGGRGVPSIVTSSVVVSQNAGPYTRSVLMLTVGVHMRMGVRYLTVLMAMSVDEVGAQQQLAIG